MIRSIFTAVFLGISCACAIEVRVPEGWSHLEARSDRPPSVRPVVRVLSSGKDLEVCISSVDAGISLDQAVKNHARWMPARGITIGTISPVSLGGHEARHIMGHLSYAGGGAVIPDEVYVISAQGGVVVVEMTGKNTSSAIHQVLGWIDFQAAAVPPGR